MTQNTIWQEMAATPGADFGVTFCGSVALVFDGEHVWITDVDQLSEAIAWANETPADDHYGHEAYAAFWGRCPGWIVSDVKPGEDFPLDLAHCVLALQAAGMAHLMPHHWRELAQVS